MKQVLREFEEQGIAKVEKPGYKPQVAGDTTLEE